MLILASSEMFFVVSGNLYSNFQRFFCFLVFLPSDFGFSTMKSEAGAVPCNLVPKLHIGSGL